MALLASGTQALFMFIIFLVAGVACNRRVLEGRLLVTLLTLEIVMLAQQRKREQVMIDTRLRPARIVMAELALLSFLSLVHVIRLMAGDTSRLQFLLVQMSRMTAFADDVSMRTA